MIIKSISLYNFRNYETASIKLDSNVNIFVGNNAQGKTNILESIYVLALTKSHRGGNEENLIKYNCSKAFIKGRIIDNKIIKDLEVKISTNNLKKVFVNKKEIKRISEYIANLNVILFTPDDLELIKGSPIIRRNSINIDLSQLDNVYLNTLNEYNKLLKNRNEYLKVLANKNNYDDYFDILTDKFVEKAIIIYNFRNNFIQDINNYIGAIYEKITGMIGLEVQYLSCCDDENDLKDKLRKNFKREIMTGMTLYGPHRDDFTFSLANENLKYCGSQGQQRMAVIAFKLAEVELFKKLNKMPLLLLDDIFSEIDTQKRNKLLSIINLGVQTIITTTKISDISHNLIDKAKIFRVKEGKIIGK